MKKTPMDPDRYQMRSIKRQIIALEKAMLRNEIRTRANARRLDSLEETRVVYANLKD